MTLLFSGGGVVAAALSAIIIARLLGPTGQGRYAVAILIPGLIARFGTLGVGPATVFYTARKQFPLTEIFQTNLILGILLGLAGSVLGAAIIGVLGSVAIPGVSVGLALMVLLIVPARLLLSFTSNFLLGMQRFVAFNLSRLLQPMAHVGILSVLVWVLGLGLRGAILSFVLSSILAAAATVLFSFKLLETKRSGGMITTNNDELADKLRMLRVHGAKPKYYHRMVGVNSRLDAIQAVILSVKLNYLDAWSSARAEIADRYDTALAEIEGVVTPFRAEDRSHTFHQYTIRVADGKRDALKSYLQECFSHLGYAEGQLPKSESASQEVLSLPIFPELTIEEQQQVIASTATFLR